MNDHLSTELRDRLAASIEQSHPDLDRLAAGAVRRGRRIRAVRRSGVALGTAAAVAAVALGVASMTGGSATTPQYASGGDTSASPSPVTPTLHAGQALELGHGVTGHVIANSDIDSTVAVQMSTDRKGVGTGYTVVLSGPYRAIQKLWGDGFGDLPDLYPGLQIATRTADMPRSADQGHEVAIRLKGWSCPTPADEKTICTGPKGASVELAWRQGDHDSFVPKGGDQLGTVPMLGNQGVVTDDGGVYYVIGAATDDGTYLTVGSTPGASRDLVEQVAESLTWAH